MLLIAKVLNLILLARKVIVINL